MALLAPVGFILASGPVLGAEPPPVISTAPVPHNWIDTVYSGVSHGLVYPVGFVDRYFLPAHEEIETNRSYLRVIGGYEWANKDGVHFRRAIRAMVRLPGVTDRLSLVFSDDEPNLPPPPTVTLGAVTPSEVPQVNPKDRQTAALRYSAYNRLNTKVDLNLATRSGLRPELAGRLQQRLPLSRMVMSNLSLTGFWLGGTGFGERVRYSVEHPFSPYTTLRLDNAATHIEKLPGITGDTRLSLVSQLSPKAALSAGAGFTVVMPLWQGQAYSASVIYRRNFYREWLFYELEPGVNWTRTPGGHYPRIPTAAIRLEIQFRTGRK